MEIQGPEASACSAATSRPSAAIVRAEVGSRRARVGGAVFQKLVGEKRRGWALEIEARLKLFAAETETAAAERTPRPASRTRPSNSPQAKVLRNRLS